LVDVEAVERRRIYFLAPEPFAELGDWVESFEELWEQRLDSLGDVLQVMQAVREDTAEDTGEDGDRRTDDEEGSP
jgi:hypothetical protein